MKEKGFTLIELLAVIVILAIIALIATPIILNIIDDTRNSSDQQSFNMYRKAVENAIADYKLKNPSDSEITLEKIKEFIKYDGNKVECDIIDINKNGVIEYIGWCKVNNKDVDYTYGTPSIICTAVNSNNSGSTAIGTQYTCQVSDTESHNFYVLSTNSKSVNLIMNSNLVDSVNFINESNYNTTQPTEQYFELPTLDAYILENSMPYAIAYLEELTKDWLNIPNLSETYTLNSRFGATFEINLTGKARLAKFEELATQNICDKKVEKNYGQDLDEATWYYYKSCPPWVMGDYWTMTTVGTEGIWAMNTTYRTLDSFQYYVSDTPNLENLLKYKSGIRPVITVSPTNLG